MIFTFHLATTHVQEAYHQNLISIIQVSNSTECFVTSSQHVKNDGQINWRIITKQKQNSNISNNINPQGNHERHRESREQPTSVAIPA